MKPWPRFDYPMDMASIPRRMPYSMGPRTAHDARSLAALSSALSILLMALSICLWPPLHALPLTLALPASVTGPVDRSHGRHVLMASDCCRRRSNVQPLLMARLQ